MFSRFYNVISEYFTYFKVLLNLYIENKIRAVLSPSDSEKIHIVRISPSKKIAIVCPDKIPMSTARKILELIMPSKDKEARQSYDYLPFYTGVIPFLSMPDDEALPIRKKRIVPYLHTMMSKANYASEMQELIHQLQENHGKKLNTDLIRDHFLSLFSRSLLGFEFPIESDRTRKAGGLTVFSSPKGCHC
jgi:hypothetical protein